MSQALKHMVIQLLIVSLVAVGSLACTACSSLETGHAANTLKILRNTMDTRKIAETETTVGSRRPWNVVHSWAYWLDNPDLKQLSASNFDLLVIDYSANGSAAQAFSAEQLAQL